MIRKDILLSLLCIGVVAVSVMMVQVGNTHLWDQDEGFYAATAAEMYARNEWITPTFNGKLFAHKPPMMFWGMMVGYGAFGISEFGARFASAVFGLGTVFLTFAIGRKLFDTATGLFAGLAISSCIMVTLVARSATADSHLTFFTALALYLWVCDYFTEEYAFRDKMLAAVRWRTWVATYAAMGLAVLTKGPIGFLFPMAVIGLFLLTEKKVTVPATSTWIQRIWFHAIPYNPIEFVKTVWQMRPFTAATTVLLVSSPWFLLVQWQTQGEFLREFIGVHHLGRMSQAMDNHSGPIYYYFVACLIGMYPWSAFAIPTTMSWISQAKISTQIRAVRFVSCWAAVYLVIFSMASTKLPNYVLPAYPALAIIVGRYFALWSQDVNTVSRGWLYAGWILLIAVGAVIVIGIPMSGIVEFSGQTLLDRIGMARGLQNRFVWIGVAGLPLLLFGSIGACLLWFNRPRLSAGAFSIAAFTMMVTLSQYVAPELDQLQTTQRLAKRWSNRLSSSDSRMGVLGFFRPTMVFYFGRDVDFCNSIDEAVDFAKAGQNSILVITDQQYANMKDKLPESTQVIERISQFPNRGEVLVLGDKSLMR